MARGSIDLGIVSKFDNKGISKARKSFKKFGGVAAGVAAGAVAAIAGIGTAAVRMAGEFETSFAKIEGLVGVSKSQLGELQEAATRLGPQFGKSANEAAEALFFITSAGLRGEEAVNVLEASLKGAAVGLGDTKTIADLATSAVNAYGSSNLDGAKAVDVLTEAVRLGKLEPAELAGAMGQVLPLASNLEVSFAEVGAAMAGMSKTGTDASTAATQLRQILTTVAKPTAEADRALANMGMSAEGIREQIAEEGLFAALETLTGAFDGNIEATTEVFGNVRALSGVLDLMGESADDNRELFAKMTDEVGVLDDAFETTSETAQFKFDKAMETARAALLPVGTTLLGIGSQLLDGLMPVIEMLGPLFEQTFAYLEEPLMQIVNLLPGLLESMLPLLPIIGQLAAIFADLAVALMPVFVSLLEAIIPIIGFVVEAINQFVVPLVEMLAPVLAQIIELFTPLIEAILPILFILLETLLDPLMRLIESWVILAEAVLPLLATVMEDVVVPALEWLADWLEVYLPAAFDFAESQGLFPFLSAFEIFAASIKNGANGLEVTVANMINAVIESFEEGVNAAIRAAKKVAIGLRLLPGFQLLAQSIINMKEVEEGAFGRVDVPERIYEFPEVDVEGISDSAARALSRFDRVSIGPVLSRGRDYDPTQAARDQFAQQLGLRPLSEMSIRERAGFLPFGTPLLPGPQYRQDYVPAMAEGGIVNRATLALIGEAGPEAVVPLDKLDGGPTYNITIQAGVGDPVRIGEEVVTAIKRYERVSGPVFASA